MKILDLLAGTFFACWPLFTMGAPRFEPRVIQAYTANPSDYPEVIAFRYSVKEEFTACSGTVVGPRAVLTAASCVDHRKRIYFKIKNVNYSAVCTEHPLNEPPSNMRFDMALCLTDKVMDVRPAFLNADPVVIGETLLIVGCDSILEQQDTCEKGLYRYGRTKVIRLPEPNVRNNLHAEGYTAVHFGDCGAPAYKDMIHPGGQPHIIKAVNVSGNRRRGSIFAPVYTKEAVEFIIQWGEFNNSVVCGILDDCNFRDVQIDIPQITREDENQLITGTEPDYSGRYHSFKEKFKRYRTKFNQCISCITCLAALGAEIYAIKTLDRDRV